jgi:hypothetical protein
VNCYVASSDVASSVVASCVVANCVVASCYVANCMGIDSHHALVSITFETTENSVTCHIIYPVRGRSRPAPKPKDSPDSGTEFGIMFQRWM